MLTLGDPARRLRGAGLALAILLTLFAGRLLQLQAVEASAAADTAAGQRLTTVALPAARGAITDRNGVPLAATMDARDVTADQTLVKDPEATAAALAGPLALDVAWLADRLTGDRRFVYLARAVEPKVWDRVKALNLAGIFSQATTRREYPSGDLAANLIGFVGQDGQGLGGVESSHQAVLAGVDGSRTYERGLGGRAIPTADVEEQPAVPGAQVRLTIDRDIQWAAQDAIAAKVAETGAESGTVVVQDVRTGEILAMATAPTFDPANPAASPKADRGNRAVSEVFEPGSTGKVMTMAAVLEEGALGPDSVLTVEDSLKRGGSTFNDHNPHETQRLTLTGVLAKSSNVGTIKAADTIGGEKLHYYLDRFGMGQPSGLKLPGESRGRLPAVNTWSDTTFPTLAFGQGYSLTALQSTQVFSTIANDGVRVQPSIVAGTTSPEGVFTPVAPPGKTQVVSAQTAQTLRVMLEGVTSDEGTAPMARIPGYRVAGKTGTAQRVDPACRCYSGYTASFIGLAPADAPRLAVSVTLQDPVNGHYGGRLAGPVFKQVMAFALQSLRIPPTGADAPVVRITAP
jgi:cell division protein FtsI (penicillin-binding protein 3)